MEGISCAVLQAFLVNITDRIQENHRQMKFALRDAADRVRHDPRPGVQNFVRSCDALVAYYKVLHRYCEEHPTHVCNIVIFLKMNILGCEVCNKVNYSVYSSVTSIQDTVTSLPYM